MKSLSVLELSKLYGINRQTIYNNVNKGILSKNSDNKIDLSEAIRVFGEPAKKRDVKDNVKLDSNNSTEINLLRQQIDILKNQLDDAKERESFYQNQIESMQRLLEAPKQRVSPNVEADPPKTDATEQIQPQEAPVEAKSDIYLPSAVEAPIEPNKRISVHVEIEPEKRGFWSRFFKPYG